MVLTILRGLFVLLMAAIGWFFAQVKTQPGSQPSYRSMAWLAVALAVATLLVVADVFSPRKKLAVFTSVLGGLMVGIAVAYAGSFIVAMLADRYLPPPASVVDATAAEQAQQAADWRQLHDGAIRYVDLVLGVSCCYLGISFILQTQDDFRFVIPYVEFSKQIKGARPMLVDTSVLIDGRIVDVAKTGIVESQLIVPQCVLDELQEIADSHDSVPRARGRLGLEVLKKLQNMESIDVALYSRRVEDADVDEDDDVDRQLIELATRLNARVLTNDFNLNQVAHVRGVDVVNLNALAVALRPVLQVGERLQVFIRRPGDMPGQGVGFLPDGTKVVVEQARGYQGEDVEVEVTNTRQTAAGRMIFARLADPEAVPAPSRPTAGAPQH